MTNLRQGSKKVQNFYVHEMLAGLRNEEIPIAFKSGHTKTVHRAKYKPKHIFESWKKDNEEVYKRCWEHDLKVMSV